MKYQNEKDQFDKMVLYLSNDRRSPHEWSRLGVDVNLDGVRRSAFDLAGQINIPVMTMLEKLEYPDYDGLERIAKRIQIEATYAQLMDRQRFAVRAFNSDESLLLPLDFDYKAVGTLSHEVRNLLEIVKPKTFGQPRRIQGVTPAACAVLFKLALKHSPERAVTI